MATNLQEFQDTLTHYGKLREALARLHDEGMRSATIIQQAKLNCDRATLDKFRQSKTKRINLNLATAVWTHIDTHHRDVLDLASTSSADAPAHDGAPFFRALAEYFDVHPHKSGPRMDKLAGKYRFFQYSEEFNYDSPELPCAVLVGEFRIVPGADVVAVEEAQAYDGQLGKLPMTEASTGICFAKGHEFFFLMKETTRETPKFCVFHKVHYDGKPRKAQWMKGYVLKGSYDGTYFHSPIYAVRDDSAEIACNIVRPSSLPPHILAELNKGTPMARATHGSPS
jgi:hypothetical protein